MSHFEQLLLCFNRKLYSVTTAAFRHNFCSLGNNSNPSPDSHPLNRKSTHFNRLSRTTIVPSFKWFRSGVFVLSY